MKTNEDSNGVTTLRPFGGMVARVVTLLAFSDGEVGEMGGRRQRNPDHPSLANGSFVA
jgi:hypothetical protein